MKVKENNYVTTKTDLEFRNAMKSLGKYRYFNGLAKTEPSIPKMTRLAMKTDAWKNLVFELKTKPEKGDLK